jgi:hypothetical protein
MDKKESSNKEPVNADLYRLQREVLKEQLQEAFTKVQVKHDYFNGDFQKIDEKEHSKRVKEKENAEKKLRDFEKDILNLS